MRPRHLVIEGLRSYRERVEIDFTDASLFAITGPTGAGKSSILEALYFALYSAATFHSRQTSLLISDNCETLTVSLTFLARSEEWEVTRSIHRGSRPPVHELRGPDGLRFDGAKEVNSKLESLIGLRSEDFLKTVVLPQGRFQALLHSKPGDRAPLLKSLLGLDQLDALSERTKELQQRLETALTYARSRRDDRGKHGPEELETLRQSEQQLQESLQRLSGLATALKTHQEHWRSSDQEVERLRSELARVQGLELELVKLEKLYQLELDLNHQLEELERLQRELEGSVETQLKTRQERLESGLAGPGLGQLQELLTRIEGLDEREQERTIRCKQLLERGSTLEAAYQKIVGEQGQMDQLLERLKESGLQLADEVKRSEALLDRGRELEIQRKNLSLQVEERSLQLQKLETEVETRSQRQREAETKLATLASEVKRARKLLQAEQTQHQVAALTADLGPEDPCPVCHQSLPLGWEVPEPASLEALQEQLERTESSQLNCQRDFEKARAAAETIREQLQQLRPQLAEWVTQLKESDDILKELFPDSLIAQQEQTAELRKRLEQERQKFQETSLEAQNLKAERNRNRSELTELQEEQKRLQQLQVESEKNRTELGAQIEQTLGADPTQWRARLEQEQNRSQELDHLLEQLRAEQAKIQKRVSETRENRAAEVDRPRRALAARALTLATVLEDETDFSEELSLLQLKDASQQLEFKRTDRCQVLTEQLAKLDARSQQRQEELETLLKPFGYKSLEEAESGRETTARELAKTEAQREAMETAMAELEALKAVIRPGEQLTRTYDYLKTCFSNRRGSFSSWLLERRQQELLEIASRAFGEMTSGHYGFSADFQVVDRFSGQSRPATTLSGGESFLASLALAIGLSELVGRKGGQLEAFFLDEGFGSLSPECLDKALGALERLAQNGRIIGVISHVEAVAQRIETVWRVEKTPEGSRIRVLDYQDGADLESLIGPADTQFDPDQHPLLA